MLTDEARRTVLNSWKNNPLGASDFAHYFIDSNTGINLTHNQVKTIVLNSVDYALFSESGTKGHPWPKSISERFFMHELRRGSLLMADTMINKTFFGMGTILVVVDSYSKICGFQESGTVPNSSATSNAFRKIMARFDFPVKKLISDRGSEVSVMHSLCVSQF